VFGLFAFDASGVEAAMLCVLACSALGAVIFTGVALGSRFLRPAPKNLPPSARHPEEMGVVALWRLDRELRAGRLHERGTEADVREVARS